MNLRDIQAAVYTGPNAPRRLLISGGEYKELFEHLNPALADIEDDAMILVEADGYTGGLKWRKIDGSVS